MSGLLRGLRIILQDYLQIASLMLYLFESTSSQNQDDWYPVLLGGESCLQKKQHDSFLIMLYDSMVLPRQVVHDRDPRHTCLFWKALLEILENKLLYSSAYYPQTDGQTKQINKVVEQVLCTMASDINAKWVNKFHRIHDQFVGKCINGENTMSQCMDNKF